MARWCPFDHNVVYMDTPFFTYRFRKRKHRNFLSIPSSRDQFAMVSDLISQALGIVSWCLTVYFSFLRFCFSCVRLLFTSPLELLLLPAKIAEDLSRRASSLAITALKINALLFCLLCSLIVLFIFSPSVGQFLQVRE